MDALTYSVNLENLRDVKDQPNYIFEKADIVDAEVLNNSYKITTDLTISMRSVFH